MKRLFVLSNGHGEDLIAAAVIERIRQKRPDWRITALPLVGLGQIYEKKGVATVGPKKLMPSGGFVMGARAILRDISAGLIGLVWGQLMTCRKMRSQTDYIISVGDVYPLYLGAKWVKKPLFFLSTPISHYVGPHDRRSRQLMKKYALKVFARDDRSAAELAQAGIRAAWLGNVMMDCLEIKPENKKYFQADWRVAILPGSREEAYRKFRVILPAAEELSRQAAAAGKKILCSLARSPQLQEEKIAAAARELGWSCSPVSDGFFAAVLEKEGVVVRLAEGALGDILANSDVVLGLAGTASEQAVGLGKMVVAFYDRGPQITKRFLDNQAKLLAGAVLVVPPAPAQVAEKLFAVLSGAPKYQELAGAGRARMAGSGSAAKIAAAIIAEIGSR